MAYKREFVIEKSFTEVGKDGLTLLVLQYILLYSTFIWVSPLWCLAPAPAKREKFSLPIS